MPKPAKYLVDPHPAPTEAVEEVIQIMDRWFWELEDGLTDNKFPDDPDGIEVSEEEANRVIRYIDAETMYEARFHPDFFGKQRGITARAGFERLRGPARIAFVQEILEAKERLGLERGPCDFKTVHGKRRKTENP